MKKNIYLDKPNSDSSFTIIYGDEQKHFNESDFQNEQKIKQKLKEITLFLPFEHKTIYSDYGNEYVFQCKEKSKYLCIGENFDYIRAVDVFSNDEIVYFIFDEILDDPINVLVCVVGIVIP